MYSEVHMNRALYIVTRPMAQKSTVAARVIQPGAAMAVVVVYS